jgi:hypothetical protein
MNNPCQVPISFYQGENFSPPPINWVDENGDPIDMAGYTAVMMARQTVNNSSVVLNASTTNGYITISATLGQIQINLPPVYTATLPSFQGVWDLFVYSGSTIAIRLVGGPINIFEPVTR